MKVLKNLLIIFLLSICFVGYANAMDESFESLVQKRNDAENYGVNKKWKITNNNKNNVLRTPLVDSSLKVYDFSDILTDEEEDTLREDINNFIDKYNMDLVIVTYSLPYSVDTVNEEFAADFYDYNDFGINFKYYDGILLFRNTYSLDKYYDMYTFGNAQFNFNQERYDDILDGIYYDLHSENYLQGFELFINKVSYYNDKGRILDNHFYLDENGVLKEKFRFPFIQGFFISALVSAIIVGSLKAKNRMIYKATRATEYLDKKSINYSVRENKFITAHTTSHYISSSSGGSSGGGGGHSSGSSGGGHSSGGGRHG